jgi:hypothetical protein
MKFVRLCPPPTLTKIRQTEVNRERAKVIKCVVQAKPNGSPRSDGPSLRRASRSPTSVTSMVGSTRAGDRRVVVRVRPDVLIVGGLGAADHQGSPAIVCRDTSGKKSSYGGDAEDLHDCCCWA